MHAPAPRIRTNLITGFLGTGKTTAINDLIRQRPGEERWAVFVNEYGMVSVDQALYESEDSEVEVAELGGGCMCCSTAALMPPVLARLIRQFKPDRLLIEPSGVGHPASVIDQLRGEFFGHLLAIGPTLCIVDPKDFLNPRLKSSPMFFDQIQLADVVVINWTDRRPAEVVRECRSWIEGFDPPKLLISETSQGKIPLEWLDLDGTIVRIPRFGDAHDRQREQAGQSPPSRESSELVPVEVPPARGRPRRFETRGGEHQACGWIFHPDEVFDRDALLDLLDRLEPVLRLKGVIRCQDEWRAINRAKDELQHRPSTYRRDSRIEVILQDREADWAGLEARLMACRADQPRRGTGR